MGIAYGLQIILVDVVRSSVAECNRRLKGNSCNCLGAQLRFGYASREINLGVVSQTETVDVLVLYDYSVSLARSCFNAWTIGLPTVQLRFLSS